MAPLYQHVNKQKIVLTSIMNASNWTRGSTGAVTSNSEISNQNEKLVFTQNYLTNPSQGYVGWSPNLINPYSPPKTITMTFDNVSNNNSRLGIVFTTSYVFYSLSLYGNLVFGGLNSGSNSASVNINTGWAADSWMYINGLMMIDNGSDLRIKYSSNYGASWSAETIFGGPTWDRQNRNLTGTGIWFNTPPGSQYVIRSYTAV